MNLKLGVKLYSCMVCGLLLPTLLPIPAISQTLNWIQQLSVSNNKDATSITTSASSVATDTQGRVYIAGSTAGFLEKTKQGYSDTWIAKYDTTGQLLWKRQLQSPGSDNASDIAVDNSGNIYISGFTYRSVAGTYEGDYDAWVTKFNTNGRLLWQRQLGTSSYDSSTGIAIDTSGNVHISGYTQGTFAENNQGDYDAWVAKYDTTGKLLWKRQLGTSSYDSASGIAIDTLNHVYISGYTQGSLERSLRGSSDAWVAKYNANGKLLWLRQMGSSSGDVANSVTTDTSDNIYVAGVTFGSLAVGNRGRGDAWVAKFNTNGKLLWNQQLGTSSFDGASGVATDTSGNVYVAGSTNGSLAAASQGFDDAWVAKYDTSGILVWKLQLGTLSRDNPSSVATDTSGNVYVAGETQGALAGTLQGIIDAWVAKFTQQ